MLGAPLQNVRWSWGAIRERDGVVFLRVWEDRMIVIDGKAYIMVTHNEKYGDDRQALGHRERLRHVELIRAGAKCCMIMCIVKDPSASPRRIESFNTKEVVLGGVVLDRNGETWIAATDRLPVETVMT